MRIGDIVRVHVSHRVRVGGHNMVHVSIPVRVGHPVRVHVPNPVRVGEFVFPVRILPVTGSNKKRPPL